MRRLHDDESAASHLSRARRDQLALDDLLFRDERIDPEIVVGGRDGHALKWRLGLLLDPDRDRRGVDPFLGHRLPRANREDDGEDRERGSAATPSRREHVADRRLSRCRFAGMAGAVFAHQWYLLMTRSAVTTVRLVLMMLRINVAFSRVSPPRLGMYTTSFEYSPTRPAALPLRALWRSTMN